MDGKSLDIAEEKLNRLKEIIPKKYLRWTGYLKTMISWKQIPRCKWKMQV